jgi:hypothetical protein
VALPFLVVAGLFLGSVAPLEAARIDVVNRSSGRAERTLARS